MTKNDKVFYYFIIIRYAKTRTVVQWYDHICIYIKVQVVILQ